LGWKGEVVATYKLENKSFELLIIGNKSRAKNAVDIPKELLTQYQVCLAAFGKVQEDLQKILGGTND
jgi:hypothetical protein